MDEVIQTPTQNPVTQTPKTNWLLFLFGGIIILGVGIAIGQFLEIKLHPRPTPYLTHLLIPSPSSDPTANWKTYTSPTYGFSFKYPTDPGNYIFDQQANFITVSEIPEASLFTIEIIKTNKSPLNWWSEQKLESRSMVPTKDFEIKNSTFVDKPALQIELKLNTSNRPLYGKIYLVSNSNVLLKIFVGDREIANKILSTFKFIAPPVTPTSTPIPTTSKPKTTYVVPTSWKRLTTQSGLNLCLPPKWEVEAYDHLVFNRDEGYKPSITYITNLPYSGGSRREAYFAYWIQEYPDVKQLVSVADTDINGNSALTIYPANSSDPKTSPEGLTVVWYAAGKLWKAGLSGWNMTNASQTSFLKDFYTLISCSF